MLSKDMQTTLSETASALARTDSTPRGPIAPGFSARILRALYLLRAALFPHIFAAPGGVGGGADKPADLRFNDHGKKLL